MDGTIATSEQARRLPPGYQMAPGGQVNALHGGLFEQLLSLPAPMRVQAEAPPQTEQPALDEHEGDDVYRRETKGGTAPEAAGRAHETRESSSEEEVSTSELPVSLLNSQPTQIPTRQIEETSQSPEGKQIEIQADAEVPQLESEVELPQQVVDNVETQVVETQVVETQVVETQVVETQVVEAQIVEAQVIADANDAPLASVATEELPFSINADAQTGNRRRRTNGEANEELQASADAAEEPRPQLVGDDEAAASENNRLENQVSDTKLEQSATNQDSPARQRRSQERDKWYQVAEEPRSTSNQDPSGRQTVSDLAAPERESPAINQARGTETLQPNFEAVPAAPEVGSPLALPSEQSGQVRVVTPAALTHLDSAQSLTGEAGGLPSEGSNQASSTATQAANRVDAKAQTARSNDQAADLSQQERVRLVQRISRSFARLGPAGGQINIKLHPPELGSLNVQVRMEGRSMSAKLSTENASARDAILESLPVLRGRLAEQGFEISQFQVEVADNNANAAGSNGQDQSPTNPFHQSGDSPRPFVDGRRLSAMHRNRQQADGAVPVGASSSLPPWQTSSGIDVQA